MTVDTAAMAKDIGRVDTNEMRQAADTLRDAFEHATLPGIHAAEEATDAMCEALAFMRSAADELEELREEARDWRTKWPGLFDSMKAAQEELDERRESMAKMRDDLKVYRQRDRDWIAKLAETRRELDELRKQNATMDAGGFVMGKLAKELKDQREVALSELEQWKRLALERQAKIDEYNFSVHSPKRLAEENKQLREQARVDVYSELSEALGFDPLDTHESRVRRAGGLRAKLAIAVETLEDIGHEDSCAGIAAEKSRKAIAAIRGTEENR